MQILNEISLTKQNVSINGSLYTKGTQNKKCKKGEIYLSQGTDTRGDVILCMSSHPRPQQEGTEQWDFLYHLYPMHMSWVE